MARHGINATAKRMLSAYAAEENEPWKPDDADVMASRDLEDTLRCGNGLYRSITEILKDRQNGTHDPEDYREIEEYYKWWLKPCSRLLAKIERFERSFEGGVEGADEFRRNCDEAEKILRIEARVAAVEARVGFRDVDLTSEAADVLHRMLDDPSYPAPRPAYEPKLVPLADPSILLRGS